MKNISEFSAQLNQTFDQGEAVSMEWLFRPLLKMLAEGDPVPVENIAAETGKPVEEVKQVLQTLPSVELDEQGRVVGYGLTLVPTPHSFEVDGKQLYAWCAQHSSAGRSTSLRLVTAPVSPYG